MTANGAVDETRTGRRSLPGTVITGEVQPGLLVGGDLVGEGLGVHRELGAGAAADEGEDIQWLTHHVGHRHLWERQATAGTERFGPVKPPKVLLGAVGLEAQLVIIVVEA